MFSRRGMVVAVVLALTASACSAGGGSAGGGTATAGANGGVASGKAQPGGTLRFALASDPDKLDPTFARSLVGREVFASMCEKLYDINSDLEVVPQLAADMPTISSDGKTVTIPLRTGITFNDGTTFDAAAVKTTLERDLTATGSARTATLDHSPRSTSSIPAPSS